MKFVLTLSWIWIYTIHLYWFYLAIKVEIDGLPLLFLFCKTINSRVPGSENCDSWSRVLRSSGYKNFDWIDRLGFDILSLVLKKWHQLNILLSSILFWLHTLNSNITYYTCIHWTAALRIILVLCTFHRAYTYDFTVGYHNVFKSVSLLLTNV